MEGKIIPETESSETGSSVFLSEWEAFQFLLDKGLKVKKNPFPRTGDNYLDFPPPISQDQTDTQEG